MKALICILITSVLSINNDDDINEHFKNFTVKYNKTYNSDDEKNGRFWVFKQNVMKMHGDNNSSWTKGVTQFFDLTEQEFQKTYLTFTIPFSELMTALVDDLNTEATRLLQTIPINFDWRSSGAVTPVKDQKQCGCCWAFSSVANIESLYYIKYRQVVDLAEQQLLNCDTYDGGCNGGSMMNAFTYLKYSTGLIKESDLPYTSIQSACAVANFLPVAHVTGATRYPYTNEASIASFLYSNGPLSVALNANILFNYISGIIVASAAQCDPTNLNHAVLIVGYGVYGTTSYWVVKNSWGVYWGEAGYFRIAKGSGTCGINSYITTATIA
jgi:cathepsin F